MKHSLPSRLQRFSHTLAIGLLNLLFVPIAALGQSPASVYLNSAGDFAVLAGATITNTGQTTITGDIGLFAGSAVDGFPPGIVIGTIHVDTTAARGKVDLATAYGDAEGRTLNAVTVSGNLGGQTLAPGLYKSQTSLAISSGDLTLDGQGDPNAVWIFQMGSSLTTTPGMHMVLAGGAQAKNVFWQVASSATLGTNSIFFGTIMAYQDISIKTGATLTGRALAKIGAVTCDGNIITKPDQSTTTRAPIFFTATHNVNVGTTPVDTAIWKLVAIKNTGTDTLKLTLVSSTNSAFTSHLTSTVIAPGDSAIDSIRYLPSAMGPDSGKLVFVSNSMTTSPDTIAVTGNTSGFSLRAILGTSSRSVNCGTTKITTSTWTLLSLYNTGNDTLWFTTTTSTNAFFTSHLSAQQIPPGGAIIDSIQFLPMTVGEATGQLVFIGNQTTSPDTIAVRGRGVAAGGNKSAILATDSREVYCGMTPIGTPIWKLIVLRNTGDTVLTLATPTSTSAAFESHLSGTEIAPGQSVIDSIKFLPTMPNYSVGRLVFTSNAVTSPDTINVNGVGTSSSGAFDGPYAQARTIGVLYPNPLTDETQLTVTLVGNERTINAGLYDVLGHELQNWTSRIVLGGSLPLHLGVYPKGEYFVRLQTTQRSQTLPVMIVK